MSKATDANVTNSWASYFDEDVIEEYDEYEAITNSVTPTASETAKSSLYSSIFSTKGLIVGTIAVATIASGVTLGVVLSGKEETPAVATSIPRFSCPPLQSQSTGSARIRLEEFTGGKMELVGLKDDMQGSCELSLVGPETQRQIVAVSLDGKDWLIDDAFFVDQIDFECDSNSLCTTTLPFITPDLHYELVSAAIIEDNEEEPTDEDDDEDDENDADDDDDDDRISNTTIAPTIAPVFEPVPVVCPSPSSAPMNLTNVTAGTPISVALQTNGLCSIWRVGPGAKERKPVARSYNNNAWEFYGNGMAETLSMECNATNCMIDLPPLEDPSQYFEISTVEYSISDQEILAARFLEQATFGPTRATIASMPPDFTDWVEDQMTMEYFSHREYFRRHLNARSTTTSTQGVATRPCEAGARYRKFAFTEHDRKRQLEIQTDPATGRKLLSIDGELRTVLNETLLAVDLDSPVELEDGSFEMCMPAPAEVGSRFRIRLPDGSCKVLRTGDGVLIGNPRIYFDNDSPPTNPYIDLDGKATVIQTNFFPPTENNQELELTQDVQDEVCSLVPRVTGWPSFVVVAKFAGEWYLHDPRWRMYDNTLETPSTDGGGAVRDAVIETAVSRDAFITQCGNPEMSFINEQSCYLSNEPSVCSVAQELESEDDTVQARIQLTRQLQRLVYRRYDRIVYTVTGLRQIEGVPYGSPCSPNTRSRWIPIRDNECAVGSPGTTTVDTFAALLSDSTDLNPDVRDVFTPALGVLCDTEDMDKFDFQVLDRDGQCWENVHQDHLQVFDFTPWLRAHPGGRAAMLQFAEREDDTSPSPDYILRFPESHNMDRWHVDGKPYRQSLGRMGDTIEMALPESAAESLGAEIVIPSRNALPPSGIVCGSPNEVANDLSLPGVLRQGAFDAATRRPKTTSDNVLRAQKAQIWMEAALNAPDQLRQKVAWALAQLLVITPEAVSANFAAMTETFVAYYDIFVRNAFGNYRDILRSVTYSPLMGEMLSYLGSRSTTYVWQTEGKLEYADENYAREVMQLFSIGLYKLNKDGTRILDDSGKSIYTYSNDEISEYARLYTGFNPDSRRGNIENGLRETLWNPIDPMQINVETHDQFPKLGLDSQYIGDGLPLCQDLPAKHFLVAGAKYRLLGRNAAPKWLSEPVSWALNPSVTRISIDETNNLYRAFCGRKDADSCTFQGVVELEDDIDCDGILCDVESLRVIEVGNGIYYEYIQAPCARLAFHEEGISMLSREGKYYCEDRFLQEGSFSCCEDGVEVAQNTVTLFDGERVSFGTAERRCQDLGLDICTDLSSSCSDTSTCDDSIGQWTGASCGMKVKIDLDGRVAILHSVDDTIGQENVDINVNEGTKSFFRVDWGAGIDDVLADYELSCTTLGCTRDRSDNLCVCDTTVRERMAYESIPSPSEALQLRIGVDKSILQELPKEEIFEGFNIYKNTSEVTRDTIFEVVDESNVRRFRKNLISEVTVGNEDSIKLTFRNPAHIISFVKPEMRDVKYEVEAALDHYMYHSNTAPFLSVRFAQRFGNSNPSPRYVRAMSSAFQTGLYEAEGKVFGSGKYGDMAALFACLLLDRETRSEILDADVASGSVFEPFARFVRFMRSMEYEGDPDRPLIDFFLDLQPRIGQMPYQMPSVFSFFLPEYQPGGNLGAAGLKCPECQKLTAPSSIALLNGILSLIKYGFEAINGGFGTGRNPGRSATRAELGSSQWASGSLKFEPDDPTNANGVIQQLSLLITSGRLPPDKLALLEDVYLESLSQSDEKEALINTMQLIATTPEFHTNGLSDNSQGVRSEPDEAETPEEPYKAVVFLMLEGGYDSFNMLVPKACTGSDLVDQYISERGEIGLSLEEQNLVIDVDGQPCEQFAIHPSFPMAKELYDSGELAFFANTGVFTTTDISKTNYQKQVPFQLFAHNNMQHEAKALDGFDELAGTGIMGRISSILSSRNYKVNSIAIDGPSLAVQSESATAPDPLIISRFGAEEYSPRPASETLDIKKYTKILNGESQGPSSIYGDFWASTFVSAINLSERFKTQLESAQLGGHWPDDQSIGADGEVPEPLPKLVERFKILSKLMQTREQRGVDRDFYYLSFGGWDHHRNLKVDQQEKFEELNEALDMFVKEMREQGRFEDVTVVVTSDFGRTLTPNSGGGSDHAWGGNYFMFGGSVDGGQIHGAFPTDLTPEGELNLGRGRLLPTTSWDCIWNGVSEWLGVQTEDELDYIMPNRIESAGDGTVFTQLLTKEDLFKSELLLRKRKV